MSNQLAAPAAPAPSEPAIQGVRVSALGWVTITLLLLAHAPLLFEHTCNLLLRPHYQFVVMLPIGVGLLAWRYLFGVEEDDDGVVIEQQREPLVLQPGHVLLWVPVLIVALGLLAVATQYRSPWIGMIAFLASTLGVIFFIGGWGLFRRLWPAWLLMFMAVPLPQNLDVRLISNLRTIATDWSSGVLDQFGIMHLVSGNVIHLPGKSLFIADACTGIHSLFVLSAVALFIGLWMRRPPFHILLLMIGTIGIVLVENVSRICSVAIANSYGFDWSEGWPHTVLGLVLFAASLLFILSADSLLRFALPRNLVQNTLQGIRRMREVAGAEATPKSGKSPKHEPEDGEETEPIPIRAPSWAVLTPFAIIFAILGVLQFSWMPSRAEQLRQQLSRNPVDLPEFGAAALPAQWNGWEQTDYSVSKRIQEDPMGEHSQTWTFTKGDLTAELSLDYPYRSLHDLTSCYRGFGWEMINRTVVKDADQADSPDPYVVAKMNRPLHGSGFLIYSQYDIAGKCDVELKEEFTVGQLWQKRTDFGLPWFQVQLITTTQVPVNEQQEQELRELFFEIRSRIVEMCLKELNASGAASG